MTNVSSYLLRPLRSYEQACREIQAKRRAEARHRARIALRRMQLPRQPA